MGADLEIGGARRGVVVRAGRSRLGVLALSDHPREYAAGEGRAGIALADLRRGLPEWITIELRRLRAHAEFVLVFPHWGPNMTVALTPSGPVLYDLGGALDDYAIDPELRNDLGVLARWRPHAEPAIELIGLRLGFCRTELAVGADAEWIAAPLERACGELGTSVERVDGARFALGEPRPGR